jgi:cell division protein FtsL
MRWQRSATESLRSWLKILGGTLVVLLFMVWQHVEARHLERSLKGMRKEEDELIYQNAHMQSQINQCISPSHLETVARKDLGMIPLDAAHRVGVELP